MRRQAHFEAAYDQLEMAWELRGELRPRSVAGVALDLVWVCLYLARYDEAQTWLDRSTAFVEADGEPLLRVRHLRAQGDVSRRMGKPLSAIRELQAARELLPPSHPELVGILTTLANTATDQGSMDVALRTYREAQDLARRLGRQSLVDSTRFNVALVMVRMERLDAARAELEDLLARAAGVRR